MIFLYYTFSAISEINSKIYFYCIQMNEFPNTITYCNEAQLILEADAALHRAANTITRGPLLQQNNLAAPSLCLARCTPYLAGGLGGSHALHFMVISSITPMTTDHNNVDVWL